MPAAVLTVVIPELLGSIATAVVAIADRARATMIPSLLIRVPAMPIRRTAMARFVAMVVLFSDRVSAVRWPELAIRLMHRIAEELPMALVSGSRSKWMADLVGPFEALLIAMATDDAFRGMVIA